MKKLPSEKNYMTNRMRQLSRKKSTEKIKNEDLFLLKQKILDVYKSAFVELSDFNKEDFQEFNQFIFDLSIRGLGYNNFENSNYSGEAFFVSKILGPSCPKICIDVGANVGNYTLMLLEHTDSQVIAFEPSPEAYETLRKKFFNSNRVRIINAAVGKDDGNIELFFRPGASSHASVIKEINEIEYVNNYKKTKVLLYSLDNFLVNNVERLDFIKIDTEGYEWEVLIGARESIKKFKPSFIQIEFNLHQLIRKKTLREFGELLSDYELYQLVPGGWKKVNISDPRCNLFYFSNFVFVLN